MGRRGGDHDVALLRLESTAIGAVDVRAGSLGSYPQAREVQAMILRLAAVVVFILAVVGVAPVPMTPLGLALWCGSTLQPFSGWRSYLK
jgi:hypothetical protein